MTYGGCVWKFEAICRVWANDTGNFRIYLCKPPFMALSSNRSGGLPLTQIIRVRVPVALQIKNLTASSKKLDCNSNKTDSCFFFMNKPKTFEKKVFINRLKNDLHK